MSNRNTGKTHCHEENALVYLSGRTRPSTIILWAPLMAARNGTRAEDPGKRQAILDQAIRTFSELGFRGTDVQVIADGAGVGKGTVYRYFRSKEELFWATTYEMLERMDRHIIAAMENVQGACAKLQAAAQGPLRVLRCHAGAFAVVPSRPRRVSRLGARVAPRAPQEDDREDGPDRAAGD